MNSISSDIALSGAIWVGPNSNPYQSRPAANEPFQSDLAPTQRPAQASQVDDGSKRGTTTAEESAFVEVSTEQLAKKLNDSVKHQDLEFSVDKDTGSTVITVTSRQTGEVVRQIPNEEVLGLIRDMQMQSVEGVDSARIFDQSA